MDCRAKVVLAIEYFFFVPLVTGGVSPPHICFQLLYYLLFFAYPCAGSLFTSNIHPRDPLVDGRSADGIPQTRLFAFGTGNVQLTSSARSVYPIDHRTHIYLFPLCTIRIIWVSVEGRNHTRGRTEFSGARRLPHRWTFYYY